MATGRLHPGGDPDAPPRPIDRVLTPFARFASLEAAGGILLLVAAALALAWANSPWSEAYFALWQTEVRVGAGGFDLAKPLLLWINDGLMAIFFFVVGLEIKRELLVGELASPRRAALPMAAALGGMLVPAAIYAALNAGGEASAGWGIPMATDIAFVLGIAALLGSKVPTALKVFLTALAIVDDLGAVLVIALFYTDKLSGAALGVAAALLIFLAIANRAGVRSLLIYVLVGAVVWLAVLKSGVHATVAGVLLAMTIPVRTRIPIESFIERGRRLLDRLAESPAAGRPMVSYDRLGTV
ncbi:MAG: Na+/H+ antiporter NhaA, partial [Acidobacteriota bacterium]